MPTESQATQISDVSNVSETIGRRQNEAPTVLTVGDIAEDDAAIAAAIAVQVALDIAEDARIAHYAQLRRNLSAARFRFSGAGRRPILSSNLRNALHQHYLEERAMNENVSIRSSRIHCHRVGGNEISDLFLPRNIRKLDQRLRRLLKTWNATYRRRTHKAQNTRFCTKVQKDFNDYLAEKQEIFGAGRERIQCG